MTVIRGVKPGSHAEECGVHTGDVVVQVNDHETSQMEHEQVKAPPPYFFGRVLFFDCSGD